MKKIILFAIVCPLVAASGLAFDGITYYGARIGAKDRVNSEGAPLTTLSAMLQQDRANYHKLKQRDREDQGESYFTTVERRQLLSKAKIKVDPQLKKKNLNGSVQVVTVWVYGDGEMEVTEGLPAEGAD